MTVRESWAPTCIEMSSFLETLSSAANSDGPFVECFWNQRFLRRRVTPLRVDYLESKKEHSMVRRTRPCQARERTIRERQDPPKWGAAYVPGQLATAQEAPDESRPSTLYYAPLGRAIHCMSIPEKNALLLGLYSGLALELHEGRMLPPEPSAGPLAGFKPAEGQVLSGHRGTIQVAERLGVIKFHPTIKIKDSKTGQRRTIGFPLLGDLLWYLKDDAGFYAVNWSVKQSPEDFDKPHGGSGRRPKPDAEEAHRARQLVETEMYREVDVPTIPVANTDIPTAVSANLRQLFAWQDRTSNIEPDARQDIIETLRARIPREVPVFETLRYLLNRHGGAFYDLQGVLYQAIWRREIAVDLWTPFNIDRPIRPETRSVVVHFAQWFRRGAK